MFSLAVKVADIWINRRRADLAAVAAARATVGERTPVVLVTGGSRGIGAALARRFAAAGHRVALLARDADALAATARDIESATGQVVQTISCNLTGPDAIAVIETELAKSGSYVDVLVNSAGVGTSGPFAVQNAADLEQLNALNIAALTRLTHLVLPDMIARRRGGILNVASLGAYIPGPNQAAYYASKAYVMSLTEAIAAEVAGRGVRISLLVPGPVDTNFHTTMGAAAARYRRLLPSMTPDAVAKSAYRGFMIGQRVIAPGLLTRPALVALKLLPHPISISLVKWLLARPGRQE
jgi:uncharacterized protein